MAKLSEKAASGFPESLEHTWASVQARSCLFPSTALSHICTVLQLWMCLGLLSPWAYKPGLEQLLLYIPVGDGLSSSLIFQLFLGTLGFSAGG